MLLPILLAAPLLGRREHLASLVGTVSSTSNLLTSAGGVGSDEANGARLGSSILVPQRSAAAIDARQAWRVTLPLEACGGGAGCLRFTATGDEVTVSAAAAAAVGGRSASFLPSASRRRARPALPFRVYRVIVDTGSPYLVVSSSVGDDVLSTGSFPVVADDGESSKNVGWLELWRNFWDGLDEGLGLVLPEILLPDPVDDELPFGFAPSDYGPTEEIYGSQSGQILWKSAPIKFRNPRLVSYDGGGTVLGVMDDALTKESGGSLIGLVKRSNPLTQKIERRPTFLEQERIVADDELGSADEQGKVSHLDVASFVLDYPSKELTLSSGSLIPSDANHVIPLVDLRPLGDFVEHYACLVEEVVFGNVRVTSKSLQSPGGGGRGGKRRDIVAVFDSGLTGCLLIEPFWDRLVAQDVDPSTFSSVEVKITTVGADNANNGRLGKKARNTKDEGGTFSIQSDSSLNRLFYVAPISLDWFDDESTAPYVIVLGQTFLTQGALTVDIDDRRATFVPRGAQQQQIKT